MTNKCREIDKNVQRETYRRMQKKKTDREKKTDGLIPTNRPKDIERNRQVDTEKNRQTDTEGNRQKDTERKRQKQTNR